MGRNKLGSMMKSICTKAGLSTVYSNHSLRAFGASNLFQQNVPEKLIQERTGHRSVEALRKYARTSEEQKEEASALMNAKPKASLIPSKKMNNPSVHRPDMQPTFSGRTFSGCTLTVNVIQHTAVNPSDCLQGIDVKDLLADFD
jgi:hypothetical protein